MIECDDASGPRFQGLADAMRLADFSPLPEHPRTLMIHVEHGGIRASRMSTKGKHQETESLRTSPPPTARKQPWINLTPAKNTLSSETRRPSTSYYRARSRGRSRPLSCSRLYLSFPSSSMRRAELLQVPAVGDAKSMGWAGLVPRTKKLWKSHQRAAQ
ncbi:hypothetical protein CGCSCA1_v002161 [Colletotrichum siamense]|nr:hypothetical protein CGCSCA1_v002161 [Colletotrichum siamense]